MNVLHVETLTNKYVGTSDFICKLQLHISPDLDRRMKQSIKNLKVGEAIKFPNGLKVKNMDRANVVNLLTYLKTQKNKDRTYDTKHTSI